MNTNIDRYVEWLNTPEGDVIYKACLAKVKELVVAGWTKYGINSVVEAVRWDHSIKVGPKDKFKVNNNFSPLLARTILAYNEDVPKGFFQLKKTAGVAW